MSVPTGPGISTHRKQLLRDFHRRTQVLLTEEDRNYLYNVLKEYQTYKQVDKLVQCLSSALDTPQKLDLLRDIRNLIPVAHVSLFDRLAPYHRMAHPFLPPGAQHGTTDRRYKSLGHAMGNATRKHRPQLNGHVSHNSSSATMGRESSGVFKVVTIDKTPEESLGFSIRGGSEHGLGVYVSEVDSGSVADRCGLRVGDHIIEVNNVSFETLASSSAVKVLTGSDRLKMVIKRTGKIPGLKFAKEKTSWFDITNQTLVDGDFTPHGALHYPKDMTAENGIKQGRVNLTATKQNQFLGLNIRGGSEYGLGIYVSKVDPGGLASHKGIREGDQIVDVNGENFEYITHSRAVQFLRNQTQLLLTIRRIGKYPAYKEMYAEYSWTDSQGRPRRSGSPSPSDMSIVSEGIQTSECEGPLTAPPVRKNRYDNNTDHGTITQWPMESKVEVFTQTAAGPSQSSDTFSMAIQTEEVNTSKSNYIVPERSSAIHHERPVSTTGTQMTPHATPHNSLRQKDRSRTAMGVSAVAVNNIKAANVERVHSLKLAGEKGAPGKSKAGKKVKRSRTFKELLFGTKKDKTATQGANSNQGTKENKDAKTKVKNKSKKSDDDKSPKSTASKQKVFTKGMGTQIMLQEAMHSSAMKMVQDMASRLLNDDESAAVMRHINRYLEERDIQVMVPPILAILDKPEKMLLLREIRGVVYPTDLGRFDSMVSRQELAAYEELSTSMRHQASPMVMRRSGKVFGPPKKTLMAPIPDFRGNFRLKTKEELERERIRKEELEKIRKEKMEKLKLERVSSQDSDYVPFPQLRAEGDDTLDSENIPLEDFGYQTVDVTNHQVTFQNGTSANQNTSQESSSANQNSALQSTSNNSKVHPTEDSLPSSIHSSPNPSVLYAVVNKGSAKSSPKSPENPIYETVAVTGPAKVPTLTVTGLRNRSNSDTALIQVEEDVEVHATNSLEQNSSGGAGQVLNGHHDDNNNSPSFLNDIPSRSNSPPLPPPPPPELIISETQDDASSIASTTSSSSEIRFASYNVTTPLPDDLSHYDVPDVQTPAPTFSTFKQDQLSPETPPGMHNIYRTVSRESVCAETQTPDSTLNDDDPDLESVAGSLAESNWDNQAISSATSTLRSGSYSTPPPSNTSTLRSAHTTPVPSFTAPPPPDTPPPPETPQEEEILDTSTAADTIVVNLDKTRTSLGISISGGIDSKTQPTVKVEKVFPGGAAADDGVLKSGMELLSVDGDSLKGVTHPEAVDIIRRAYNNKSKPIMEIVVKA